MWLSVCNYVSAVGVYALSPLHEHVNSWFAPLVQSYLWSGKPQSHLSQSVIAQYEINTIAFPGQYAMPLFEISVSYVAQQSSHSWLRHIRASSGKPPSSSSVNGCRWLVKISTTGPDVSLAFTVAAPGRCDPAKRIFYRPRLPPARLC